MILWFSGTGNSRHVASLLSQALGEPMAPLADAVFLASDVVWVFPVYSWGVPPYVLERIKALPFPPSSRHHAVMTCGDDSGRAAEMFRRSIAARGGIPLSVCTVIMPNNYVCLPGFDVDSPELAEAKLASVSERVAEVAAHIRPVPSSPTSSAAPCHG